jgi:ISXO2-like transposase domain
MQRFRSAGTLGRGGMGGWAIDRSTKRRQGRGDTTPFIGSAAAHAAKAEACTTKFWSPAPSRCAIASLEPRKRNDGRYAGRVRLAVAADRSAKSLCGFVDGAVAPGTLIVTDDWSGYADLRKRGYDHHAIAECGDSEVTDEFLPIIHLVFANLKTWLTGIHHGVSERHLQAYLNEFTFRFNRRFYPFNAFRSLLGIASDAKAPTYAELYSGDWNHPTSSGCMR